MYNCLIRYQIHQNSSKFDRGNFERFYKKHNTDTVRQTVWGSGVTFTKSFLKEEKLKTSFGESYNHSGSTTANINVMIFRLGANCMPWKQHNFNLNFIQMFRNADQAIENPNLNEMTCILGYNYNF